MVFTHGAWELLISLQHLEIDALPNPARFVVGDKVTGTTSEHQVTVIAQISDTEYIIRNTEYGPAGESSPHRDFTDDEILSDESGNSRDCATGYPIVTAYSVMQHLAEDHSISSFWRNKLESLRQRAAWTDRITKREAKLIGRLLVHVCENQPRDGHGYDY